ncbi:MAG TPA: EscU/YscU/HrcU family type III secretion system export apparatus switch protein, partial [Sphingorhabdus sp.]
MAEAPDRDQQTEAPTPKRRKDAAEEGDVLISRELASALVILAGIGWLALAGQWLVNAVAAMLRNGLAIERSHFAAFELSARLTSLLTPLILPFAALLLASLAAAIAGPALLGSLGWRSKAMAFKASRLSPLSGIKRIFGMQGLIELAKALAKAGLLGGVGWWLVMGELPKLLSLSAADPLTASASLGSSLISLLLALGLAMLLIALLDVPAQNFQRFRRLRMSREQVKEELRQSEGAPELKAQLRARQQARVVETRGVELGAVERGIRRLVLQAHDRDRRHLRPAPGEAQVTGEQQVVDRGRAQFLGATRTALAEALGDVGPFLQQPGEPGHEVG